MTRSPREPQPIPVRRYRYSKLRWRILVHVVDAVGAVLTKLWRSVAPARASRSPRRILIVQLDHMGDAVLTTPILPRLRAAYPEAVIDVLASRSNREVFESDPHVRRVHVADRNWFERRPKTWALWSAVGRLGWSMLRPEGYDLGIDVRGDLLSILVLFLAGIPRRVGWAMGGGGFLLTDVARWEPGRHEVASRLALLKPLGIVVDSPIRVTVHPSDSDRAFIRRRLRESRAARAPRRKAAKVGRSPFGVREPNPGETTIHAAHSKRSPSRSEHDGERLHAGRFGSAAPLLAVHLGAGTAAKRWPIAHWKALSARFLADGWRIVVVGGEDDVEAAEELAPHPDLLDWTGQLALTETAALLERADLFIGSDSGPAHLAASAGIPSVILFSGTNRARQWRPWSRRSLVLRHRVPCRPCHRKVCPLADHPCLAGITPDRVYKAARRWWARLHRSESPHVPI
jgi:ADP-heptose:LPS heptosyltransferase